VSTIARSIATSEHGPGPDLSLWEVLVRLWNGRWYLLASIALFAAVFAVIAFAITPEYRAVAVLLPAELNLSTVDPTANALGSLTSLLDFDPLADQRTEEALAVMRSREFTEEFIRSNELLPVLYARYWDGARRRWKYRFGGSPTIAEGGRYFHELCNIWKDPLTGLINFQLDWRDPGQAALWVNQMVERLNAAMRARAIAEADAGMTYLRSELSITPEVETRDAIAVLMESQINKRMLADVSEQYSFRVVDRALVADVRDPERPRKVLLISLGALTGAFWGAISVFMVPAVRSRLRK
jgi:hypothetical protein